MNMKTIQASPLPLLVVIAILAVVLLGGVGGARAQANGAVAEAAQAAERDAARDLLDSVREDLVNLRFEKALAAIAAVLGKPGMTESERAEALVLRAQAHVAFGDLNAAEDDYRAILRMRPGYQPEPSLTPTKAMDRYRKVRSQMVGHLRVTLDPADARLLVDDREVTPGPDGLLPLLAGEHALRGERSGHDPFLATVSVTAGSENPLRVELVPNARTLVMRTEPAGVEVLIDGVSVGRTARPTAGPGAGQPSAELVIENVPLGEHTFGLVKECYRTERLKDVVNIDLLDRQPKIYKPVNMVPASSTLSTDGGPAGAPVFVDGKQVGRLPLDAHSVCPGDRQVEVRFVGRVIWRSPVEFQEAQDDRVRIEPRPNAAVIGADGWPRTLGDYGAQFSTTEGIALPEAADLETAEGWAAVDLPANTDLALAVVPDSRKGAADRWYLYSPLLDVVRRLDASPAYAERPVWSASRWGMVVVDSDRAGSAVVVGVGAGGPASPVGLVPGDRIVTVGGREVSSAAQVRQTLAAASAGRGVEVGWRSGDGTEQTAEITAAQTPLLIVEPESVERAMLRAAWSVVDALTDPDVGPTALANLALLFGAHGHAEMAVETWRRVRWPERQGIGEGTRQYYLGRELERLGREDEAIAAYRLAATSQATTFNDEGPEVAPAARDRLADLGVSVSAR